MKTSTLILFFLAVGQLCLGQGLHIRNETNITQVVDSFGLSGDSVLIIIIDRGIDYRHPDFIDSAGNTRIEYVYDMINSAGANDPNNPYGIGTIFDKGAINQSLTNGGNPITNDRGGHGTATTGIAAGNGSAVPGGAFQGVAPNARIISIKLTQDAFPAFGTQGGQAGFFNPTYIPVALEFAKAKIAEIGLPSVTLMNLGSIGGPTDGTSLIARKIDEFVDAGNIFVCGVGDDGGQDNYAEGTVPANQEIELNISKGEAGFLRMDLWYDEADKFSVSIERPNGMVQGLFAGPSGPNAAADQNLGDIQIYHRGANVEFFEATSNRRELMIDFTGPVGIYKVKLKGSQIGASGFFQATLNPATYTNQNRFLSFFVSGHSINDYASASKCVVPGDYVVKNNWVDVNGVPRSKSMNGDPGNLWTGCSAGPTHDGRTGVDFVTPGELCYAAYSPNTYYHNFAFNQIEGSNGFYGIQNAVSGSAPVATGIIALLLEANPTLSPAEMDSVLELSCRQDSFTNLGTTNDWGAGKLDAYLAVLVATGMAIDTTMTDTTVTDTTNTDTTVTDTTTSIRNEDLLYGIQVYPNPARDQIAIQSKVARFEGYELIDTRGKVVRRESFGVRDEHMVSLRGIPKGIYFLRVLGLEQEVVRKILVEE